MAVLAIIILSGCGRTQKMHQKAYDYSEAGNYQAALEIYQELLKEKPDHALLLNDYGWTLFMADSLERARQVLNRAKSQRDKGILLRNIRKNLRIVKAFIQARDHLEGGAPEKAKEIYDELDKSWKTHDMRLKYYALVHESLGNKEKADEYWQKIVDRYAEADFESSFYQQASQKLNAE